jgi:hypothetical protein
VQVRVIGVAGWPFRVTSGLKFDEVTFNPADAPLLGFVEDGM